ncbi:MAG: PilZ domain-containing protein [Pseudolabrys sp.]|nr:PilZ domain-containing protein [Pseudolabrys sp.]MBV9261284.1 PilZ domain-containing protein [Pseudolabrys sp.]
MLSDKRRSTRRPIRYTAWIKMPNDQLQGCALSDISDTGARLDVENVDAIPSEFILMLSSRGTPQRKCKVVWRNDSQIGVDFDRKAPQQGMRKERHVAAAPSVAPDGEPQAGSESEAVDVEAEIKADFKN